MPESFCYSVSLRRLGDDVDLFKELAKIFLQDVPEMRQHIAEGFDKEDHEQVAKFAHKLKGITSSFDETGELTAEMETMQTAARQNDMTLAQSLYKSVSPKIDTLHEDLQAIVDGKASPT